MEKGRRRRIKTRRPKEIDLALGVSLIWVAFCVFWLLAGAHTSGSNFVYVVIIGVASALLWGWAVYTIRARNAAGKSLEEIRALSPAEFEEWVGARFRDLGYSVKVAGASGDHGVDLVAEKAGEVAVVQCKQYKKWSVGEPVLRDLYGAMHDFRAAKAYLVTTGKLTTPAAEWVKDKAIEVWDGDHLARLSMQNDQKGDTLVSDESEGSHTNPLRQHDGATENASPTPSGPKKLTCPKCGSFLVERQNRQTGEFFFACPRYPQCRFTRPLPS